MYLCVNVILMAQIFDIKCIIKLEMHVKNCKFSCILLNIEMSDYYFTIISISGL